MKELTFTPEQIDKAINMVAVEKTMEKMSTNKAMARGMLSRAVGRQPILHPDNYTTIEVGQLQAKWMMMMLSNEFDVDSELTDWYTDEVGIEYEDDNTIRDSVYGAIIKACTDWFREGDVTDEFITSLTDKVFEQLCMEKDMQEMKSIKFKNWMLEGVNREDLNLDDLDFEEGSEDGPGK
jgi:hypothetical protein